VCVPPHSAVQPLLCRVHAGGEDSWEIGGVVDVMDLAKLALESAWGACGDRCWVGRLGLCVFLWPPFADTSLDLGLASRGSGSECGRGTRECVATCVVVESLEANVDNPPPPWYPPPSTSPSPSHTPHGADAAARREGHLEDLLGSEELATLTEEAPPSETVTPLLRSPSSDEPDSIAAAANVSCNNPTCTVGATQSLLHVCGAWLLACTHWVECGRALRGGCVSLETNPNNTNKLCSHLHVQQVTRCGPQFST
jgi:hypothetical protein